MKLVLTGATGMVGEGVLIECLATPDVERVLVLTRKPCGRTHEKLTELVVPDFLALEPEERLAGYDGCLYCAGITSLGMSEADYTRVTLDTPVHVARALLAKNPGMVFCYVTGRGTDGSEKGSTMWARVKGRAENALMTMGFHAVYNFRPALMLPQPGQKNVPLVGRLFLPLAPVVRLFFSDGVCTLSDLGRAMLQSVRGGAAKSVLEVADIVALAAKA